MSLENSLEYIINECNKNAENYKKRVSSPKNLQKQQEIKENLKPPQTTNIERNESKVEKEEKPISLIEKPEEKDNDECSSANILSNIMKTIDEDHELDDKDIDQYINN